MVTDEDLVLVTDSRFTVQAEEEAPQIRLALAVENQDDQLPALLRELVDSARRIGVDGEHLTLRRWERLRDSLERESIAESTVVSGVVSRCRMTKFPDELEALQAAGVLVTQAFEHLENTRVVGRSERAVAMELEFLLRGAGSEGVPFNVIVAAGPRAAMPHGEASEAIIGLHQLLVVDIGTVVGGYASDMTRTYATGSLPGELTELYEVVMTAQARARDAVRPGLPCSELDGIARAVMAEAGKGDLFLHGLGHGVGLEVHEDPRVSGRSADILGEAMVVTIEPGAYVAGKGGVRIEDTVAVGSEHGEVLTNWPRDLKILS
jgi:Xaa-Pro aminopeptidase